MEGWRVGEERRYVDFVDRGYHGLWREIYIWFGLGRKREECGGKKEEGRACASEKK